MAGPSILCEIEGFLLLGGQARHIIPPRLFTVAVSPLFGVCFERGSLMKPVLNAALISAVMVALLSGAPLGRAASVVSGSANVSASARTLPGTSDEHSGS